MASKKKKTLNESNASSPAAPTEPDDDDGGGAIVALAFDAARTLHAIDGRGRVVQLVEEGARFAVSRVLHDVPRDVAGDPATALAPFREGVVVATGSELVVFGAGGARVATRKVNAGPVAALVTRSDTVFALGGGYVTRYALEADRLVARATVAHGAGIAFDLDLDDAAKRALVLRDRKVVEILDLDAKKVLHTWERKGLGGARVDDVGARFQPGKDAVLSVTDAGGYTIDRVATKTGRVTGKAHEHMASAVLGPMMLDVSRRVAAVGVTGEDVEVVDLGTASSRFLLDPVLTEAMQKSLASLTRIPKFKPFGPGLWKRAGSDPAPLAPSTLTAMALDEGGAHVAAGFASGEVLLADTATARIVSTHRAVLAEGRCRVAMPIPELVATGLDGNDLWLVGPEGTRIVDIATSTFRDGPRLLVPGEVGPMHAASTLSFDGDRITRFGGGEVLRFSRQSGELVARVALPNADGWRSSVVRGREIVFVESADVEVSGFPLQALDLDTGKVRSLGRFVRDKKRFPFGDPDWKGWFALGSLGDAPTITLWPGKGMVVAQTHFFDLDTLAVGEVLPWDTDDAEGRLLVTETEETDGVRVRDLVAGTEVCRVAFDPGERRRSRGRYDVASGTLASTVSDSRIGVWDKDGRRRFSLPGHRDGEVYALAVGGQGLVSRDRYWLRFWDLR